MTPDQVIEASRGERSPRIWRRFALAGLFIFPPALAGAIYGGWWLWNLNIDGFSKVVFFALYAVVLFFAFVFCVGLAGETVQGVEPYKQDSKAYSDANHVYMHEARRRASLDPGNDMTLYFPVSSPENLADFEKLKMPTPPNPLDYYKPKDRAKMEAHADQVAREEAELEASADWKREWEYQDRLKKLGKPPKFEILQKQASWRLRQHDLKRSSQYNRVKHSGVHLPTWFDIALIVSHLIRMLGYGVGIIIAVGSVFLGGQSTVAFPLAPSGYLPGLWGGAAIAISAFILTTLFIDLPAVGLFYLTDGTKRELKELREWRASNPIDDALFAYELDAIRSVRSGISYELLGLKKPKIRGVIEPDEFELKYQLDARELKVLRAARDGGFIDSAEEDQERRERLLADKLRDQKWEEEKYAAIQVEQDAWDARKRMADVDRTPLQVAWEDRQTQERLDELCLRTFGRGW